MRERTVNERNPESKSDPVERADARRNAQQDHDVSVDADGEVHEREHGNMDESLLPKGKDHPEQGPYEPEHDGKVPDVDPDAAPGGKGDLGA